MVPAKPPMSGVVARRGCGTAKVSPRRQAHTQAFDDQTGRLVQTADRPRARGAPKRSGVDRAAALDLRAVAARVDDVLAGPFDRVVAVVGLHAQVMTPAVGAFLVRRALHPVHTVGG